MIFKRFMLALVLILMALPLSSQALTRIDRPAIHILASTSLTEVMTQIARDFSMENNVTVSITFENPKVIAHAIEQGEPANVVIAEDPNLIRELKQKGQLDVQSISVLARNYLVLAAKRFSRMDAKFRNANDIGTLMEDINEHSLFVLGNPDETPLGKYALDVLKALNLWEKTKPYAIRTLTSHAAQRQVERGSGVGILYRSSLQDNPQLSQLVMIPHHLYDDILYQGAVVAGKDMEHARKLVKFMKSQEGEKIFTLHGFEEAF